MNTKQQEHFKLSMSLISIMGIYLFSGLGNFMSAVISVFAEHWSDVDITQIRLVSTIPALVSVVVMLLVAGLVGKVRFRTISIVSLTLTVIGGIGPLVFAPSWSMVLLYRVILGIGVGGLGCRSALLMKSVPQEHRAKYIGIAQAAMSLFGVIAGPVTGILAEYGWNMPFLVNGLAIIGLALVVFFLHEPDAEPEEPQPGASKQPGGKEKMPGKVYFFVVFHMLLIALKYPLLTGMSTLFAEYSIGAPVMVGTVLSSYTLGCMASAFIEPVRKCFGRFTMAVGYALSLLGIAVILIHPSLVTCFAGCIIGGAGFQWSFSMLQVYNAEICSGATLGKASTLLLVAQQVGVFLSNYLIVFFHGIFRMNTDIESALLGACICFAAAIVMCLIPGLIVPKNRQISGQ